MTKKEILKELNKGKAYREISRLAENLLYKLCPLKRDDIYEGMFDYLFKKDLEKLGYEVYEIGAKEPKKLEKKLKGWGFLYTYDVFFNPVLKEIWCVKEYVPYAYVSVDDIPSFSKLIDKKQFQEILANKIMEKLES